MAFTHLGLTNLNFTHFGLTHLGLTHLALTLFGTDLLGHRKLLAWANCSMTKSAYETGACKPKSASLTEASKTKSYNKYKGLSKLC